MGELDSKSPHYQTALAMAALAAAIAATMQELWPDEEPLSVLLTKSLSRKFIKDYKAFAT